MKKSLLLFSAIAISIGLSKAQTNSDASQNMPNGSATGYIFNFDGDATENCIGNQITGDTAAITHSVTGGVLTVTQNRGLVSANGWHGTNLDFVSGNCATGPINLSGGDQVQMWFNTGATTVPEVYVYLCDNGGNCTDSVPLGATNVTGAGMINVSNFIWRTWNSLNVDNTMIQRIKVQFRTAWNATLDGTFQIGAITIGDQTGLTVTSVDEQLDASLNVYPNPASSSVNVDIAGSGSATLTDVAGNVVGSASGDDLSIDTSGLPAGIYVLQVESNGAVATRKVVVE